MKLAYYFSGCFLTRLSPEAMLSLRYRIRANMVTMPTMFTIIQYQKGNLPWWWGCCLRQYLQYFAKYRVYFYVLIVLHVMNIRYGHIPHFSVNINSYWIYWFWKLFLIAVVSLWLDHISTLVCKGSKYFFSVHFNKLGKWMFCSLVVLVLLFLRV